MVDGFWTVEFQGIPGYVGGGVVVLLKGRIIGGDSQYYYTGTYTVVNDAIEGKIDVIAFVSQPASVFGTSEQRFGLTLSGQVRGVLIDAKGARAENPRMTMGMRLTRRSDLPA